MPVTSRKRKSLHTGEDEEAARAIFQKHFEAQFAPLPQPVKPVVDDARDNDRDDDSDNDGSDEDEDEEWEGISDDKQEVVEIVDHTSKADSNFLSMGKRELKAFMVRGAPSGAPLPPSLP